MRWLQQSNNGRSPAPQTRSNRRSHVEFSGRRFTTLERCTAPDQECMADTFFGSGNEAGAITIASKSDSTTRTVSVHASCWDAVAVAFRSYGSPSEARWVHFQPVSSLRELGIFRGRSDERVGNFFETARTGTSPRCDGSIYQSARISNSRFQVVSLFHSSASAAAAP